MSAADTTHSQRPMQVLVIGGTGLISGAVTRALIGRGHVVTIFHRGSTMPLGGLPANVRQLIGDRSDTPGFINTLRENGPWDCVIDMIGGTQADAMAFAQAVSGRTQQVIACSTTSVYGRPFASVPVREDAACAPSFPYGQNKLAYEQQLRQAAAENRFALSIIRPGHTYDRSSPIIHSLGRRTSHLDRLIKGRPIIVHDDGQGLWSMAWADDIAEAFAGAVGNKRAKGRTSHVTGADTFTWNEYHGALAAALGAPDPEIIYVPATELARLAPERTQQCLRTLRYPGVYDCSAAREDLGYSPKVGFAQGLARNVTCLRAAGHIEAWSADDEYEKLVTTYIASSPRDSIEADRLSD